MANAQSLVYLHPKPDHLKAPTELPRDQQRDRVLKKDAPAAAPGRAVLATVQRSVMEQSREQAVVLQDKLADLHSLFSSSAAKQEKPAAAAQWEQVGQT